MRLFANIFCLLCFMITVYLGEAQDPKIAKSIDQESKPAGAEGRLTCSVSNKGDSTVIWQKDVEGGSARTISRNEQIMRQNPTGPKGEKKFQIFMEQVSDSMETYTLAIRRLTMSDGGSYTCMLMLPGVGNSKFPRQRGKMVVQLPPQIMRSSTTTLLDKVAGETARLLCDASGIPTPRISWSRSNGRALPDGKLTYYGKELIIRNVSDTHRGVYKCQAENNVRPPASTDITLRVRYPPSMIPFRDEVGQMVGNGLDVEISCRIAGDPMPDLQWYQVTRNGKMNRIFNDQKHEIHVIDVHPGQQMEGLRRWLNLRIKDLKAGDFGYYVCRGENMYGVGDGRIKLFMTPTCQNTGTKCSFGGRDSAASVSPMMITILLPVLVITYMMGMFSH